jgi:K+-sensing histidine kinase KdpD
MQTKFYFVSTQEKDPKYSGTGLSLAICKRIIDNHGGYIKVQSEQGVGTEFNIFYQKNQSYFKLLFLNLD